MKQETFEHKCCNCGFCCIMENCPIAIDQFNIPKFGVKCPALLFNNLKKSSCHLAKKSFTIRNMLGIGVGCCIKATVFSDGNEKDFAACNESLKFAASKTALLQKGYL